MIFGFWFLVFDFLSSFSSQQPHNRQLETCEAKQARMGNLKPVLCRPGIVQNIKSYI